MADVINTGVTPKDLWPGINAWWGTFYKEWDGGAQWKKIFPIYKSNKNYEQDVGLTGYGLSKRKPEGEAVHYDIQKQAFTTTYTNITYALGYIITQEAIEDNLYAEVAKSRTQGLARSDTQTRENVCANILNRAFNSNFVYGDEKALITNDHPIENGTYSNTLENPSDLNEAALEELAIIANGFVDNRGLRAQINATKLVIPRELRFQATRILKGWERSDTADRDINALYMDKTYSEIVVNQYLSDPDAFFVLTDCPDGLKYFERMATKLTDDNDFDTNNLKYKVRCRYSVGATDSRGILGSPGA